MIKKNRKGFTITELVIVIAVIAILAAVLIPTFGGIVNKANDSADLQEARSIMTHYVAYKNAKVEDEYYIQVGTGTDVVYFKVLNGELKSDRLTFADVVGKTVVTKAATSDGWPQEATATTSPANG